jgi:hypothetical protein
MAMCVVKAICRRPTANARLLLLSLPSSQAGNYEQVMFEELFLGSEREHSLSDNGTLTTTQTHSVALLSVGHFYSSRPQVTRQLRRPADDYPQSAGQDSRSQLSMARLITSSTALLPEPRYYWQTDRRAGLQQVAVW